MRIGADGKNILTKDPVFVSLYEETDFYILQGAATEKKSESEANGDYFSCFSMDDGNYHICLSDGMGSGSRAKEESEMVVELMQKFIEAGFKKETAVQLLNSTMVLQGEDNSFSTLDYAVVDTYTGELELIKIGGAATFIKRGDEVECIDIGSLPAGADAKMETEIIKRKLMSGDFLVMVTDGMIEYLHVRNPKDVMMDMISRAKTENAQGMAEYIMTQVMILTGGFPKDDMTILVTGIWEK
jgi:stage II sporulation protein E